MSLLRKRSVAVAVAVAAVLSTVGATAAPVVAGDPTEGRNVLTDDLSGLADLNLSPDFNLAAEQKRKVAAVRAAYEVQLTQWRTAHAADFARLQAAMDQMQRGRGDRASWMAFSKQRQDVLATLPEVNDSLDQIAAALTDEQRAQFQERMKADGVTAGGRRRRSRQCRPTASPRPTGSTG